MNKFALQWLKPESPRGRNYQKPEDCFSIIRSIPGLHDVKSKNKELAFGTTFTKKYFPNGQRLFSVAFTESELIFCFKPNADMATFKTAKKNNSLKVDDSNIVDKIYDFYKLDQAVSKFLLKVYHWRSQDGLDFYVARPQDYLTGIPVFNEDEY